MMATQFIEIPTALEVEQQVAEYLINNVGDRICVTDVDYDLTSKTWRVKIGLSYPVVGVVGVVGEALVTAEHGIERMTSREEMEERANVLYQQNKEKIEAAFSHRYPS
jgi:hypothetical protein